MDGPRKFTIFPTELIETRPTGAASFERTTGGIAQKAGKWPYAPIAASDNANAARTSNKSVSARHIVREL
jgi:hypothetical protein